MRSHELTHAGLRLARWRSRHNLQQVAFWTLVVLGPLLAFATFAVLTEMQWLGGGRMLRPVLLADFVYALVVAGFVGRRVAEMIAARRRKSAGSKLHMRLVRFFTLIALIPTVLVAVFATITLNFGLEGWFSDRVRNVVANSLAAAEAYEEEHRVTLQTDARALGDFLNDQKARNPLLAGGQLRDLLTRGQLQMQRALPKAYVIDGDGQLRARGERSYLFRYTPPSP
jgi:two-component system nitrogen regulation sensor histidine kinase NtrY